MKETNTHKFCRLKEDSFRETLNPVEKMQEKVQGVLLSTSASRVINPLFSRTKNKIPNLNVISFLTVNLRRKERVGDEERKRQLREVRDVSCVRFYG